MYLLDTDTLTHLHAGNYNVLARLKSVIDIEVGITIITKVEVLRGRIDYLVKAESGASLLKVGGNAEFGQNSTLRLKAFS
jgi:tRNA(fMet)-specific endonuclease VapC